MEDKLAVRTQVVDVLMQNAIVTAPSDPDGYWSVVVPGAIREENLVAASDEKEAKQKVRDVLIVKEQSRLEGQAKAAANAEQQGSDLVAADVTIESDNVVHSIGVQEEGDK